MLQVTIAGGVGQKQVKQLAYDLCKAVPLLSSDYSLLVDGIKVRVAAAAAAAAACGGWHQGAASRWRCCCCQECCWLVAAW
jgi:hypothetical protein